MKKFVAFFFCLFFSFLFAFSQAGHQSFTTQCERTGFTSQGDCYGCADFCAGFFIQTNSFNTIHDVSAVNLFTDDALLHPVFTDYHH
ncbi:MAG TPA: hypothetical protein VI413_10580 [Paludibacter sp.]